MTPIKGKKGITLIFSSLLFVLLFSSVFFTNTVFAQKGYQLLAEIPTITQPTDGSAIPFPVYLKGLIVAIVGLSVIFTVIMIIIGGIEYVMAEVPSAKSDGKKKIIGAIGGLLIALFSYLLLITINPDLTLIGLDLNLIPAPLAGVWTGSTGSFGGSIPGNGGQNNNGSGGNLGNGTCTPINDPTNYCDVKRLADAGFGNHATEASAICNGESIGGQVGIPSGSDKCADGHSVSWGLFQINITAHNIGGLGCPASSPFKKTSPFTSMYTHNDHSCTVRTVAGGPTFEQCRDAAINPDLNIQEAIKISGGGTHWGQWGFNSKCEFNR